MKKESDEPSSIEIKVVLKTNGLPPCRIYTLLGQNAEEFVRKTKPGCKLAYRWNDTIYIPEEKDDTSFDFEDLPY